MLDLKGKGACAALFDALTAAGCPVHVMDGALVATDEAAAQAVIDTFTLAQAKAARCAEVSLYSGVVRDRFMAGKSAAEMASWPLKVAQAVTYTASGDASQVPMLAIEAQARGVTLSTLVAKVNANAQAFSALEATIAGIDGKHRDAIMALDSFAAVASYNIAAGWPAP
jgi:hypothetical protein